MSSEFLSDREQEEALRSWWRDNWRWVVAGIAVGFAVLIAWNFWQQRVEHQGEAAAGAYRELTKALALGDKDKVEATVKSIDAEFTDSPYAAQAHLLLAQSHVNGGRFEMAATELKTVVEKSKDSALVQIAKMRLARVQVQLGHFDEALALLDVAKAGAFAPQFQEIRGDALFAKGDNAGARAAYQASIVAAEQADPHRAPGGNEYLQLKLQELIAASVPDAAPTAAAPAVPTKK